MRVPEMRVELRHAAARADERLGRLHESSRLAQESPTKAVAFEDEQVKGGA